MDVTAAATIVNLVVVAVVELIPVTNCRCCCGISCCCGSDSCWEGVFAVKLIACAVVDRKALAQLETVVSATVEVAQVNAAAVQLTVPVAAVALEFFVVVEVTAAVALVELSVALEVTAAVNSFASIVVVVVVLKGIAKVTDGLIKLLIC